MNIDNKNNQTDDLREINKFSEMASEWWDPNGKFAPLHKFNPVRQEYLVDKIKSTNSDKIGCITGDLTNMETGYIFKEFFDEFYAILSTKKR